MIVSMEVSLYPLGQLDLGPGISEFIEILKSHELQVQLGPMSSVVVGDDRVIFQAIHKAFEAVAQKFPLVLVTKISNACPIPKLS